MSFVDKPETGILSDLVKMAYELKSLQDRIALMFQHTEKETEKSKLKNGKNKSS